MKPTKFYLSDPEKSGKKNMTSNGKDWQHLKWVFEKAKGFQQGSAVVEAKKSSSQN